MRKTALGSQTSTMPTSTLKTNIRKGKRKLNASTKPKNVCKKMRKTTLGSQPSSMSLTEFDAVGINIAKKLQRMQPTQAIFAESIINQALTKGLLGTLTCNTSSSLIASYTPGEVAQSWQDTAAAGNSSQT